MCNNANRKSQKCNKTRKTRRTTTHMKKYEPWFLFLNSFRSILSGRCIQTYDYFYHINACAILRKSYMVTKKRQNILRVPVNSNDARNRSRRKRRGKYHAEEFESKHSAKVIGRRFQNSDKRERERERERGPKHEEGHRLCSSSFRAYLKETESTVILKACHKISLMHF